ncbi:endolytic transglycosylase MltG [bacterium]|nr:endolytic transglycosylase MltG [bacterium]
MKRKILPVFAIGFLGILTVAILLFIEIYSVPTGLEYNEPIHITVPKGATISTIAQILQDADLVEEAWKFETAARLFSLDRKIRAGKYKFDEPLSAIDLAKALTTAGYFDIMATFPEGSTIFDIARIAHDSIGIDSLAIVSAAFDSSLMNKYNIHAPSFEGYLYPETYSLPEGETGSALISRMAEHFTKKWDVVMSDRAEELDMSINEVITLASIIEAEARVSWEQTVIASVYHNRLRRGMLLQADPTVIYGLRSFDRTLTTADLDTSSCKYNTYRFTGLPPGAICNPAIEAIFAALWPDSTDYLFFVSNENGTHWFSRNLEEHYAAIRSIRKEGIHGPIPEIYINGEAVQKETPKTTVEH